MNPIRAHLIAKNLIRPAVAVPMVKGAPRPPVVAAKAAIQSRRAVEALRPVPAPEPLGWLEKPRQRRSGKDARHSRREREFA